MCDIEPDGPWLRVEVLLLVVCLALCGVTAYLAATHRLTLPFVDHP